jgi:hypothetical protein
VRKGSFLTRGESRGRVVGVRKGSFATAGVLKGPFLTTGVVKAPIITSGRAASSLHRKTRQHHQRVD